jgi:hypothetical protein
LLIISFFSALYNSIKQNLINQENRRIGNIKPSRLRKEMELLRITRDQWGGKITKFLKKGEDFHMLWLENSKSKQIYQNIRE